MQNMVFQPTWNHTESSEWMFGNGNSEKWERFGPIQNKELQTINKIKKYH